MNRRVSPKAPVESQGKSQKKPFDLPSIFRDEASRSVKEFPKKPTSEGEKGIGIIHLLFICLALAVSAAGILYHLHIRFEGVRLGYEASEQRKIQTRLMLQRRELRLELASMKEPGRIEDEAREKLGMETPKAEKFVHINKTKKVVSVSGGAL